MFLCILISSKRKRFTEAEEEVFWRDYDSKQYSNKELAKKHGIARNSISALVARWSSGHSHKRKFNQLEEALL